MNPSIIPVPDPLYVIAILVALSLAPFMAMMVTSYLKMVVVFSLIRNALGVQTIPPNTVINGLAIILSIYVMTPVFQEVYTAAQEQKWQDKTVAALVDSIDKSLTPMKDFLIRRSDVREREFFLSAARNLWGIEKGSKIDQESMIILIPAFTVSELNQSFEIGFLTYLPFTAIDIIVSNILLALGMMMVSPMMISLPFKLLLFVMVDGWARLVHGLVMSYSI